jgi:hypothetical protein
MNTKRVTLTEFRKNLLEQEKVRVAWTRFINRRFISYGPFSAAVDEHIRSTGATR